MQLYDKVKIHTFKKKDGIQVSVDGDEKALNFNIYLQVILYLHMRPQIFYQYLNTNIKGG